MGKRKVRTPDLTEMEEKYNALERLLTRSPELLWRMVGPMVRLAGRTPAGRFLMEQTGRLAGAALAETGMFGMEKAEAPAEVAGEWIKVLEALGCEYEVGRVRKDEVEVFMLDCPAGLSGKNGREVCLAGMSADLELVRQLGGELIIGDTIATGAGRCHLKVVSAGI